MILNTGEIGEVKRIYDKDKEVKVNINDKSRYCGIDHVCKVN